MSNSEAIYDEEFQRYMEDCQAVDNQDSKIVENKNCQDIIQSESLNKDDNQQNNIEQNNQENMGKNTQNNQVIGEQRQNNDQNNFKKNYKYIIHDNKTSEEIFNYGIQLASECEQILKTISSH
ncbi:hypothetical protein PPERSA_05466 [Pseudocohnilembus persalinus]|uniref:Uncharacterized protein n=1 Tax=Pseudocohnilembus persalinus TaxID=266149 RepID=A0A0V0R832_PSEPJ|nr:hypothetical protein PPERSA_05466 [Pseudocohnilembus persalinus]|eukprot:KRX10646.1 hypothetical protein PPERSA_05466 [Pseudocohnilembus persalinus]